MAATSGEGAKGGFESQTRVRNPIRRRRSWTLKGTRDPEWAISQAKRFVDAGAYMIMIESEGITENVKTWRTDVVAKIINALRLDVRCDFPSSA